MKYKKGFICGFFDLIHDGHIDILRQAKEQCEYLIVGVGTDEFMKERKGRNSVLTYEQRCTVVDVMFAGERELFLLHVERCRLLDGVLAVGHVAY